ncbi:aminoglycoside phosphotransferase family protein [Geminicoccaceae bacterium 1502E]|nr:aminoglycoside phosphotransferase family protein [Geminicoccaceae bacterium 1502E]
MSIDVATCRAAVVRVFPDLRAATFRPLAMGWHSLALDVDDRLIFKFPRGEEAARALRREVRLLAAVRPHLAMRVPDLELVESPMLFSRHTKIAGDHLLARQYGRLPAMARERLAEDLALFAAQLHDLDPDDMRAAGAVGILPWRSLEEIRRKALPLAPETIRPLCERTLAAFQAAGPDPLGTVYGFFDGHGWNMAFDHKRQRLNGIYDFADSGMGPVHQELVYPAFVSHELTRVMAGRYARLTGRPLDMERIAMLIGMHRLSELAELAHVPRNVTMARDHLVRWAEEHHTLLRPAGRGPSPGSAAD